ncbi:RTX toxin [Paenibacillus polymyxa]|uniref:S-layer homology domain-containing protein n=2 Tax=Paenibacillus polymyxa TaxID=1406 RepID=UPI0005CDEDD7|nr:S-layer homology domain-containing protein [Paenibacillus polymyxa]KJD41559.1 RTX toxin [Paenibacillus polymyxa]
MSSKPNKWLITLALAVLVAPTALQTIASAASDASNGVALASLPFKDINNIASEQKTSILQAIEAGLMHGDPSGSYRPTDLLTRQEMAVLLTQALQLSISKAASSSFSDVDSKNWSSPYIEAVHRAGLMNGDDGSKFRPKAAVTREEAAVLLMRAAGLPITANATESAKLTDWNRVSPWARPYVNTALQSGSMKTDQSGFKPKSSVQRQDIAQYMMSTFFPKDHVVQLQKVEDGKAWINGIEYKLSDSVKGILQTSNQEILKGADIQFVASQRTIESITKLVIHASGQAPIGQASEFSGNLVLDGHNSSIDGDLTIDGDYISVMNLNVKNSFTVTSSLEHDFYASKFTVQEKTYIQGGDQNTVLFNTSELQDVEVSKQDVRVVIQGNSRVDQMTLTSNATIENDSSSMIQQLKVLTGAQQVELQGTIQQLSVNSDQPVALTGQASINTLVVSSSSSVSLEVAGTISNLQVNNSEANISVSSSSQVTNTSFAAGVSSSTVSGVTTTSSSSSSGSSRSTVVTNTAPKLVTKYDDQAVTVGDSELQIDLLGHFTDEEQSELKYTAVSSSTKISTVRVEGTNLSIKAVGKGTATITIAADDQAGKKAGTSFKVRVNESPVSLGIPDQSEQLGSDDVTLSLGSYFTDSENDPMTYEVVIDDPSIATFTLTGDQLVLTPAVVGHAQVTVKASDGRGGSANQSFQLVVSAGPNQNPVVNQKPGNQTLTVGDADYILDLSPVFLDPDSKPMTISAESSDPSIATVSVNGNQATVHAVSSGTANIQLKAANSRGGEVKTNFDITVNEPPASMGIPDQTKQINSGDIQLSLNDFFTDHEKDSLSYSIDISDSSVASAVLNGDTLTITPLKIGSTSVSVKASDGHGGSTSRSFQMEVTAVPNQNPVIDQQPGNQTLILGNSDYTLDLSSVFHDPDGDPVDVSVESSNSSVAAVSVNGNQVTVHAISSGTATIQLKAEDGRGGEVTTDFDVTVNESPVSSGIPDQIKEINTGDIQLSLNDFFSSPDSDILTYDVSVSDSTVVTADVYGDMLTLTPLTIGSTLVSIKATGDRGGQVIETFKATVTAGTPENQNPVETKPADQSLTVGGEVYSLDLGSVFTDPDGDTLTFKATSSDPSVASAEIAGAQLKIQALSAGTTSIEITAMDGRGGETSTSFQVSVQSSGLPNPSSNQPPQVDAVIYEQVLTAEVTNARSYDLSQLFSDADGDALTFTSTVESSGMVNAEVNGSTLTLTPGNQAGSTKVTITADDGHGGKATYNFQVTNAPLATNGIIQIRTKQGVKDPITYDMSTVFPGETSFKVYSGTADSTFTGPTPLNGTVWTWNGGVFQYFWVIGANGSATVFQVISNPQGPEELYFSQYLSLDKTRTAIELFYNPVGDTSKPIENAGYSLEIHQYNLATNTPKVWSQPINSFYKGMPYIYIDSIFYDFFDIIPATYYNDEIMLLETDKNVTTGYVLKKNGVTIDVLGDPDGKTQFMPNNGTIIRKSGIKSGSSSYNLPGEWNSYPSGTLQYFSHHTP